MATRKIDLMHQFFGTGTGTCGGCSHLIKGIYHGRRLKKCEVYGLTHSEASDWAMCWPACGLINQETNFENIIRLVTPDKKEPAVPLDGQVEMEDK